VLRELEKCKDHPDGDCYGKWFSDDQTVTNPKVRKYRSGNSRSNADSFSSDGSADHREPHDGNEP